MNANHTAPAQAPFFTPHQVAIIKAWSEYEPAAEAALALGLAESTLKTHFKRMRAKLNVKRTFEVYKYMAERQLL